MSKKSLKWKYMKYNGKLDRSYKVYEDGRIYDVTNKSFVEQKDLCKKSVFNGTDYQGVMIRGYSYPQRVHRIVCETFHGTPKSDKIYVIHKDENRRNNKASNLKWATCSEYVNRSRKLHTYKRYPKRVISQVKKLINKGYTNDSIAQKVKMSDSNISSIKYGYIHTEIEPLTEEQVSLGNY